MLEFGVQGTRVSGVGSGFVGSGMGAYRLTGLMGGGLSGYGYFSTENPNYIIYYRPK